ncbi:MAG: hypothetical protein EOP11_00835 [Proteobacteria bacterium]|nr:MAG: hypothetical protein EOP11_00835 [Pseudomonadota bacterium]
MKRSKLEKCLATLALGLIFAIPAVHADDSKMENKAEKAGDSISETASDAKRGIKKGARKVKDSACELVNGKMECAGKKVKNKAKDLGDKMEDAAD